MAGEVPGDVADADSLDPAALGFMCGLEIHQQLATGKLHSRQPSILFEDGIEAGIERKRNKLKTWSDLVE